MDKQLLLSVPTAGELARQEATKDELETKRWINMSSEEFRREQEASFQRGEACYFKIMGYIEELRQIRSETMTGLHEIAERYEAKRQSLDQLF